MKVFLSYAAEDRHAAHALAANLHAAGHDVYPAAHWPSDVIAALRRAEAYVVLLSPAALRSPYVLREIELALVSRHLANKVIPVILHPSRIPWILERMNPIKSAGKPEKLRLAVVDRVRQIQVEQSYGAAAP